MTNTRKDVRVAEIIEPKPELPGNKLEELSTYLSGQTKRSAGKAWCLVFDYETGDRPEWDPLPFISAPTFATDGIVLEWVQGQDAKDFDTRDFMCILLGLIDPGQQSGDFTLHLFLNRYKPGMYAHALLAVEEV